MLKLTKKQDILLILSLLIIICGAFIIQNPSTVTKLFLIDSRVTQQPISLSVSITGCDQEDINATVYGEVNFTNTCNNPFIISIYNIPANSNIKLRVYKNDTTPTGFTAPATTLVTTIFNYINITLNTTLTGTARIYFNITQAALGSIDTDDIKLYKYTTSWNELTTTVIDGTGDPAEFSATTDSFSPFLIGEAAEDAGLPTVTPPLSGPISKGGLKLGLEKPVPRPKPAKLIIPTAKKIIEKIIKLPAHLIRYRLSYNILYITTAALIIFILALEAIYHYIKKRRNY